MRSCKTPESAEVSLQAVRKEGIDVDQNFFEDMDRKQTQDGVAAWLRSRQPEPPTAPLPPGITADMSPECQQEASRLYAEFVLRKAAVSLTAVEREYIRAHAHATLRELDR